MEDKYKRILVGHLFPERSPLKLQIQLNADQIRSLVEYEASKKGGRGKNKKRL